MAEGPVGFRIRGLVLADVPRLREINAGFRSEAILQVEKVGDGPEVTWRLQERPLLQPFDKKAGYDITDQELAALSEFVGRGQGLLLVAEAAGKLVALLEVRPQEWNHTAFIWNILVDRDHRRRGLGRRLMEMAIAWAQSKGYRALCLETQSNNIAACRFYHHMGFRLTGIRDDLYTNRDIARGEVALFWSYPLPP